MQMIMVGLLLCAMYSLSVSSPGFLWEGMQENQQDKITQHYIENHIE